MLPPPPPNFQRIAFHGIALLLPETTNLSHYQGTRHAGALLFNNLHSRQLELRWKTPKSLLPLHRPDPYKTLDRTLQKIARKSSPEKLADNAFRIATAASTLLLIADAKRIYELTFPTPLPSFYETFLPDFLASTPPLAAADLWPWQIYGIQGNLPRHARLTATSFLPGTSLLSFTHQKTKTHLASHSLADRLLHNRTLPQWAAATFPFLKKIKSPTWHQTETTATLTQKPHTLTLTHDQPLNLIRSTHQIQK